MRLLTPRFRGSIVRTVAARADVVEDARVREDGANDAPQLPAGYATMVLLAMFPALWRCVMDRRLMDHYGGDIRLAALSPRKEKRLLERYLLKS